MSVPLRSGRHTLSSFSAPDDAQTADIVTAIVVLVCAYGGFQGLRRCFRGAGSAFWTSTLGRWLIGRIAGTLVFAGLAGTGFFLAQRASVPVLEVLFRLGVPFSSELLVRRRAVDVGRPDPGRLASADDHQGLHRQRLAPAAPADPFARHGRRRIKRLRREFAKNGANRWKPGMVLLGASMFDRNWLVGIRDDRGIGVVAGNGGGKGRSSIIPHSADLSRLAFIARILRARTPP